MACVPGQGVLDFWADAEPFLDLPPTAQLATPSGFAMGLLGGAMWGRVSLKECCLAAEARGCWGEKQELLAELPGCLPGFSRRPGERKGRMQSGREHFPKCSGKGADGVARKRRRGEEAGERTAGRALLGGKKKCMAWQAAWKEGRQPCVLHHFGETEAGRGFPPALGGEGSSSALQAYSHREINSF